MEIKYFEIDGLFELIPDIFRDERGFFLETFNRDRLLREGIQLDFVQDNQSFSRKNVLRGLHYQSAPHEQGKLVRVITGKALDVAVDIRPGSPTFGKHIRCILDEAINNMFFIPPGFAHGFLALTDIILLYKCTESYQKESEGGIRWNDKDLAIDWGISDPIVSEKDTLLPDFRNYNDKFTGTNPADKPL